MFLLQHNLHVQICIHNILFKKMIMWKETTHLEEYGGGMHY